MTALLIRGVRLADDRICDLAISDGRIVEPADVIRPRVFDAAGLIALPGLVDLHTHLRQPGREDAETIRSGTRAAARGGYTAVFAMPNTDPVTDTVDRAAAVAEWGRRDGATEVIPVGAITRGQRGQELADLAGMHERCGVTFFSDDGHCVQNAQIMRRAFEAVAPFHGVLAQHSQDSDLAGPTACCHESDWSRRLDLEPWPAQAESVIIARDVQLAELTGARLHVCHVSAAESVDVIRWAKARGVDLTAEVTPHHLLLGTARLESLDTTFKVNPPLRTSEHTEALRDGLADGTIDVVATDHAPHAPADKNQPFPLARPGMLGLEQALGVVLATMVETGRLDWRRVTYRMSVAPARIGGIGERQGRRVCVGAPANLVLLDPSRRTRVDASQSRSQSRNNPYDGLDLPDPVRLTLWRGNVTYAAPELGLEEGLV